MCRALRALAVALWIATAISTGNEKEEPRPKTSGTESDPLIQLEVNGLESEHRAETLLACLNQLPWASRTAVLPRYPGNIAKDRLHPKATAVVALPYALTDTVLRSARCPS
jgi:hypothetical protein